MAPITEDRTLRAINYRLKNTPAPQLPRVLGHITSQLVSTKADVSNNGPEAIWLRTRITSLLQDRSPKGRLCGVVTCNTVLDLSSPTLLIEDKDRVTSWLRVLLEILKKPGLGTTKQIVLVTITRLYMLTWEHQTLVREMTTPTLPTFITTCLQQCQSGNGQLIDFVLESFATLLPRHPTVFRSYAIQIRSLAISTLCGMEGTSAEAKDAAAQVLALLHQCAQKNGGAAEWEIGLNELLNRTHASLDQVFRAVGEDWQSVAGVRSTLSSSEELPETPQMSTNEQTGFPGWTGLHDGLDHVKSLLLLLRAYLSMPTPTSIRLPLGRIVDLLTRILYVQVPKTKDAMGIRFNTQIAREERDQLLASLPDLHVAALETTGVLLERLQNGALPLCAHFINLLTWLFQAESFDASIRASAYTLLQQILNINGPTMEKNVVKSSNKIVQSCCKDLLPFQEAANTSEVITSTLMNGAMKGGKSASNNLGATNTSAKLGGVSPSVYTAAWSLLPVLYNTLPTNLIPKATRTLMDRTAILTSHTEALEASVLNPAPGKPSLLPFLSAIAPASAATEAILRPRLPVLLQGKQQGEGANDEEVEEEDEQVEMDEDINEEQDESMYEPKIIDWADVAAKAGAIQAEQPRSEQIFFGNLASAPEASSTKRNVDQVESAVSPIDTGMSKKPRIFDGDEETEVAAEEEEEQEERVVRRAVPVVVEMPQVPIVSDETVKTREMDEIGDNYDDDGDDDGSDFEIPKLVMKGDGEDEDEEEDA